MQLPSRQLPQDLFNVVSINQSRQENSSPQTLFSSTRFPDPFNDPSPTQQIVNVEQPVTDSDGFRVPYPPVQPPKVIEQVTEEIFLSCVFTHGNSIYLHD